MKSIIAFLITVALVVVLSIVSTNMIKSKKEFVPDNVAVVVEKGMTVAEFAKANKLENPAMKKIFGLESKQDLQKQVESFGFDKEQLTKKVNQAMALTAEDNSKSWQKIFLKFVLWFAFLFTIMFMLIKKKINAKNRKYFYIAGFVIFGVIMGADPSPMGTVKDAIVLLGKKGVIFMPRLIAFCIFTALVIIANKFICSWGCQFGTLQDFILRLNRNDKDTDKGALPLYKPPFVVTNTVRVLFFIALCFVAFKFGHDITEEIDPFKIFKPQYISIFGGIFIGAMLIMSLFMYRPWCLFFCPFGLTGWLAEKISIFRIKVDYDKCISCESCEKACPSTVMSAILKRDKTIPDCFSCGVCINSCPTDAVSFSAGKRDKPPVDKFNK